MKKLLSILFITACFTVQAQVKKVLFLGNSYTSANNLPLLVKNVALSFNDTIFTDQNTPGGKQLIQHASDAVTLSKISSQNWDNVIIQEQSQKPAFNPSYVATEVYPYAEILCDSITANYSCSEPIFYMTWGRKNGDAGNCASYPPLCTYEGMQQKLRERYMQMSLDNNATTSPVGVAWSTVRDSFPSIELYTGDESHPNIYGSYLAACVFYTTLYQKSPIGSTYIPNGISNTEALNLQTVASYTVLDSLPLWRINANKPIADFNFNVINNNGDVTFTNTSNNDNTYHWSFGDGNTSSLENPTHTYTGSNNTYNVELIIYSMDSCFSDTITQIVDISATGIIDINKNNQFILYPNPANDFIELKTNFNYTSITIVDITGKAIKQVQSQTRIDVSSLSKGIYFIQLIGEENTIVKKFVKE
ncbi:MAG: T9SS type A sorting domain-containing protein [Vicingaceae bacterium]